MLRSHVKYIWRLFRSLKKKKTEVPSKPVDSFCFASLYIYLCILSECHSNRRMSICMTTGWGAEREPQGETVSTYRSQSLHIAIFFIQTKKRIRSPAHPTTLLLNMTIKQGSLAVCITILAGWNNRPFYCYSTVYKTIQCHFIKPI